MMVTKTRMEMITAIVVTATITITAIVVTAMVAMMVTVMVAMVMAMVMMVMAVAMMVTVMVMVVLTAVVVMATLTLIMIMIGFLVPLKLEIFLKKCIRTFNQTEGDLVRRFSKSFPGVVGKNLGGRIGK